MLVKKTLIFEHRNTRKGNTYVQAITYPKKNFQWQFLMISLWIKILKVYKNSIKRKSIMKELFHLFDSLSTQFFDSSHNVYSTRWGWFVHMENIYYWIMVLILFLACSAHFPSWADQWYYVKKHVEEQTPEIRKSGFKHEQ